MASEPASSKNSVALLAILSATLLVILLTTLLTGWLVTSERGAQTAFSLLQTVTAGRVTATEIQGRLLGPLRIGKLKLRQPAGDLHIEQLQLEWQARALQNKLLHIRLLRAASVRLALHSQSDTPPGSLALPFQLLVDKVEIGRFFLEQQAQSVLALDELKANLQFDGHRLTQAAVNINAIELTQLQRTWPHSRFSLHAQLETNGSGRVSVKNLAPGRLDQSGLPLRSANANFTFIDSVLQLSDLKIDAGPGAQLNGSASFSAAGMTAVLETRALNLHQLDARLRATHLNGHVAVKRSSAQQTQISLALAEPWQQAALRLTAEAKLDKTRLTVTAARLQHAKAYAEFSGAVELSGAQHFSAQGKFHQLRPQDFVQLRNWPSLLVNAGFTIQGKRGTPAEATLEFEITKSRIQNQALAGKGKLILTEGKLVIPHLLLMAGANRLSVNGALRESASQLEFSVHAPQLAQLGPQMSGALHLSGSASGTLKAAQISAKWQVQQLLVRSQLQITEASGELNLQLASEQPFLVRKIDASGQAQEIRSGTKTIGALALQLQASNESLLLKLNGKKISLDKIQLQQGQLDVSGTLQQHSIAFHIVRDAASHSMSAESSLSGFDQHARWRGNIDRVQLAALLALFKQSSVQSTDAELAGEWDLQWTTDANNVLQGTLGLRRRSGDLTLRSMQTTAPSLGLQQFEVAAQIKDGKLKLRLTAEGKRLGLLTFSGSSAIARGKFFQPDLHAAMHGLLTLQLPSINWIGSLLSSRVVADGNLQADLTITGSWSDPRFSGHLQGRNLRLLLVESGINLQQGVLDADFTGNSLTLRECQFAGTSGLARVTGSVTVSDGKLSSSLVLHAAQFGVYERSDRQLVVSGDAKFHLQEDHAQLAGNMIIDRGSFDIGRAGTPQLSDDVIVTGRTQPVQRALQLDVDLGVGLGQRLELRGRGLNARTEGALRFTSKAGAPLQTFGLMQISKGTYAAYGRALTIERGILRFDGAAGNPALDIRAMRRGMEVEAGVSIGGTAMAPRITLVSEPQVPDAEKLAWLVLGRGLSSAAGNELGDLQAAAASLFSQGAAASVQSQLATAFGLDTIRLSTTPGNAGSVQQRIITLGKRVSSRLTVSYQQGLQNAAAVVVLRYTLSQRVTVEAESGTRSVFSLFYNLNFD